MESPCRHGRAPCDSRTRHPAAQAHPSRGVEGREKTLQETLVTTQKIAEEFKENSRREAELVLREAHLRAEKFLQDAREEHTRLTADITGLRRLRRQLGEEIMNTLATHKRLAEQALAEGDGVAS